MNPLLLLLAAMWKHCLFCILVSYVNVHKILYITSTVSNDRGISLPLSVEVVAKSKDISTVINHWFKNKSCYTLQIKNQIYFGLFFVVQLSSSIEPSTQPAKQQQCHKISSTNKMARKSSAPPVSTKHIETDRK